MKRYFCDRCSEHIDIDRDGFAEMRVICWSRGADNANRMKYEPDYRHNEGDEKFMMCATCANEFFGQLDGMVAVGK